MAQNDHEKPLCGAPRKPPKEGTCAFPAGWQTEHEGYGWCRQHKGASWKVEEAWRVAHRLVDRISDDLVQVSPTEALLWGVRLAVTRVLEVEQLLEYARWKEDGKGVKDLMRESRAERSEMLKASNAAINAGVSEALVRHLENEGRMLGAVLADVFTALGLDAEQRAYALTAAKSRLLAIEGGSVVPGAEMSVLRAAEDA